MGRKERQSFRPLEKGGETYGYKEIGGDHALGLIGRDPGAATGTRPLMGSRVRMANDWNARIFALWLYIWRLRACADRRERMCQGEVREIAQPSESCHAQKLPAYWRIL
jgi:hypothetical protein